MSAAWWSVRECDLSGTDWRTMSPVSGSFTTNTYVISNHTQRARSLSPHLIHPCRSKFGRAIYLFWFRHSLNHYHSHRRQYLNGKKTSQTANKRYVNIRTGAKLLAALPVSMRFVSNNAVITHTRMSKNETNCVCALSKQYVVVERLID